jgi:hypothetical protein
MLTLTLSYDKMMWYLILEWRKKGIPVVMMPKERFFVFFNQTGSGKNRPSSPCFTVL